MSSNPKLDVTSMDFSMYSLIFRHMVLIPSGGWFGDLVILLSALSGVWDISITAALVVLAYIGLRTTYTEITVVLGALFDLIIPLQYHFDETFAAVHEKHLEAYWPIFLFASVGEAAAYILLDPSLFTLVVFLKTTATTAVWLTTRSDGSMMSFGMDGPANKARVATSQDAVPPPVNQPDPVPQPRPVVQPRAAIKPGPVDDSQIDPRLSASRGRSHSRPGIPIDPRFPDADDRLKAAGYDLLTREGMIRALRENRSDPEHAVKHWVQHSKAPGMQARAKVYADAASEMRQGKDVDKVLKKYKLLESAARSEGSGLGGSSRGNGITTKALAAAVDSELKRQGKGEALRSQVSCELEAAKSGSIVKEILDRHRLPLELWDQYGKSVPQEGQGRPSRGKSKGGTPEQRGPRKDSRPVSQLHLNMLEKRIQEIGYLADDEEKACQEADAEMKAARSQDEVFNVIERYLGGKHSKAGMSLGIDWFARQHQRLERSGFHRLTVDEMLRDLALQPTPEDTKRLANSWRNAEAPQLDQGPAKAPTPSRAGSKQQEQRQGGHYAFPATEVDGFVDRMKKDGYPSETIEKAKRELLASDGPKAANEVSKKYLPARDGGIVLKPESLKGIKKALIQKGKELGWSEDVMMSTWGRINSIHNKRSIEVLKRFCKETLGLTLVV